jgi:hypothetical protein
MSRNRKILIAGGVAAVLAASSIGVASAVSGGDDDGDRQATGPAAAKARAAALAITHGGTANAVERDSENGATWEVEITRPDGKTVDVRLDERYDLVVVEGDSEASDASDADE